jgi:hypothetical protein
MQANKTQPVGDSVETFIANIPDERRRRDSKDLAGLMRDVTGLAPVMWGTSIVGFGLHHYRYESGREGDTPIVSFAPRKGSLVVYGVLAHAGEELAARLGPHTVGKGCLYIKDLSQVDISVLGGMIGAAFAAKDASSNER